MFYSVPNLVSTSVSELAAPWDYKATSIPASIADKKSYREFCLNPATKHAFISAVEALDPRMRASYDSANPPLKMHGVVLDYDAEFSQDMLDKKKLKPPSEFFPSHVGVSFSGNVRAIWQFEKPILLASKAQYKKFAAHLARHVMFNKWFAGFETEALSDPCHYYEIGRNWQGVLPDYKIPSNVLELWLYECSKDIRLDETQTTYDIPIEKVAAEVEAKFPGRWKGTFELGKRGVRFWDVSADNETAAMVRKDGMQCFTGEKGFVSWREIFGSSFVEKFEADRVASIREVVCYDGRAFWVYRNERWAEVSKDDFGQFLRVQGFSAQHKAGGASEIDRIESDIKVNRFVRAALPFVHLPQGIIIHKSEPHLNYSTVKCLAPAPPVTSGRMNLVEGVKYFPWLWDFFTNFFDVPPAEEADKNQLEFFLAWLKHFYGNALAQKPRPGQVVVIAGPQGRGKTFLVRGIVAKMVGGSEDASNYLVEGQQWTDHVCESPIMAIDDSLAANDPRAQLRFTSLVKKVVANMSLTYNGKFKKQGMIPWYGRVTVTSNLDPESLKILPNMEISVLDKISLFKAANSKTKLPGEYEQTEIVSRELPYFCRWLLDWDIPDHIVSDDPRYGVRPYHQIDLHRAAVQQGNSHIIFELISEFIEGYAASKPGAKHWEGRVSTLYRDMLILGSELMHKISMGQLATGLGMLASRGLPIQRKQQRGHTVWVIPTDISTKDHGLVGQEVAPIEIVPEDMQAMMPVVPATEGVLV